MLKIMTKMYVQNMPVAMFLAAQLVLVSFIFNISCIFASWWWLGHLFNMGYDDTSTC